MSVLFTRAYWQSVGWLLIRTLLAALVPFAPHLVAHPGATWLYATMTVSLTLIVTLLSTLKGLPDATGPLWQVVVVRTLRQFAQVLLASVGSAVLLTDVDWRSGVLLAAGSAATTLLLALLDVTQDKGAAARKAAHGLQVANQQRNRA